MPHHILDHESRYQLLKLIAQSPALSQRELAGALGMSLGKANYCVRTLIDSGWVKLDSSGGRSHKAAHAYELTPKGVAEKAHAAHRALEQKVEAHARMASEIEALRAELEVEGA